MRYPESSEMWKTGKSHQENQNQCGFSDLKDNQIKNIIYHIYGRIDTVELGCVGRINERRTNNYQW